MIRSIALTAALAVLLGAAASAQQNVLVNGDFESNPPPKFGNNKGHPIDPWVLGTGDQSNVVKVDGPGGTFDYGTNGPESDASAPGSGIPQHYLDIADGFNDFYQSFRPECSGEVEFGGYFSTRANSDGTASVTLSEGVGTQGPVVGQTNQINLPAGDSETWNLVSFTAQVTAFTTYSFVVEMDNNMNFDNGFVRYRLDCPTFDPCCPPWSSDSLEEMLIYEGSDGIGSPFTLRFQPTNAFKSQIQAYIDYLNTLNPAFNVIVIHFMVNDAGTGATPVVGAQVGSDYFTGWIVGQGGQQFGATNFFTLANEPMVVNRWYRIHTGIFLFNAEFFPETCANNDLYVRIQVQHSPIVGQPARPVLQLRKVNGRTIEKPLP
jgi:hypothetical protein